MLKPNVVFSRFLVATLLANLAAWQLTRDMIAAGKAMELNPFAKLEDPTISVAIIVASFILIRVVVTRMPKIRFMLYSAALALAISNLIGDLAILYGADEFLRIYVSTMIAALIPIFASIWVFEQSRRL